MKPTLFSVLVFTALLMAPAFSPASDSIHPASSKPLDIMRVTPDGEDVPAGRQIVIQFDRPVVPLGRMARSAEEIPVEISPALNCRWRWLNTSALACQLDERDAMRPSTAYRLTVHPGIKAADGSVMSKRYHHRFITKRPAVRSTWLETWRAPGVPVILLTFNQPVAKKSVEQHVYMMPKGTPGNRFPLNAEADPLAPQKPHILPPGAGADSDTPAKTPSIDSDPASEKNKGMTARRVWLVSPKQALPLGARILLMIEPGLISPWGPQKGVTRGVVERLDTFPEFKFLGIRCRSNDNQDIHIAPQESPGESPQGLSASPKKCNPLGRVALVFNTPVVNSTVKSAVRFSPDLAGGRDDYDPWLSRHDYSRLHHPHYDGDRYEVSLPVHLQAAETYHLDTLPGTLKDEFGRPLPVPMHMTFVTDHRKPDINLIHKTAVLEKEVETQLPLVVTNLDEVHLDYTTLTSRERVSGGHRCLPVPKVADIAFPIPLGVREMLGGRTGAVQGYISTRPSVDKHDSELAFFAQVTPFQVHAKIGYFNTMVWVTDLAGGQPVADAAVTIYRDSPTGLSENRSVHALTDNQGIALLAGTDHLDPELDTFKWCRHREECRRLFVRVAKGDDLALLPLERRFQVDEYQVSNYTVNAWMKRRHGHMQAWGTTAQGVYRTGDTVQYKVYVRNQNNRSFTRPPRGGYRLEIIDPTGKTVHEVRDIQLSPFGAFDGEFTLSKNGAVGWYGFTLGADFTETTWQPMRVLVSDFTPSPFRVETEMNGDRFHPGDTVTVTTRAKLHAGGPYAHAAVRVTAELESRPFSPAHPLAAGFWFDSHEPESRQIYTVFKKIGSLDDRGNLVNRFQLSPKSASTAAPQAPGESPDESIIFGRLTIESAVQDDRGKYIAAASSAAYVGRDRFVGLKAAEWLYQEDEPAHLDFLVVDAQGNPTRDVKVNILVERLVTKASRVKGAGNAYLTHYTDEWTTVSQKESRSRTTSHGFRFIPQDPGTFRITAAIQDTGGRPHSTRLRAWVAGKGRVLWHQPQDQSLQIIPEKDGYQVGDNARYLVKNPFPGATALITIERYGVIRHWQQVLESSTPVIEFPVEADYLPGFYLSVLVVSPRVDKPPPDGDVDLGKPTFRMGYTSTPVKDTYKQITVQVTSAKAVYRPGEKVRVTLRAAPGETSKNEPVELAVAVLDEAVFDLLPRGRSAYDPYKGFYRLGDLDLQNYSLLTRLAGRQKIEKKGASPAGGGGSDISLRSVFKFVGYWNPSLRTDAQGAATVEFEAPHNLTGWRVFAMAVTPTDRMGLGDAGFKVNRPTEVRPVMPNQVTEGDRFTAGFSVMNRTDAPRALSVAIQADGPVDTQKTAADCRYTLQLAAYERQIVRMPIQTRGYGRLHFAVTARDHIDGDGLKHTLPVNRRRSLDTAAVYGSTTADEIHENIRFPREMHTDVGRVSVAASPSVMGSVEGAFGYMRDYPYTCWEQMLSKGVMASHYLNLRPYLPERFSWKEAPGIPQETLDRAADFQAPNGGMAYYLAADRYVSPYLSAYTALAFNWLRAGGYAIPGTVAQKLRHYLQALLKRDVFPDFYSKGMSSTVRAVALAALAAEGRVSVPDLERYRSHVPLMNLFGQAHYLQAAMAVNGAESIAAETAARILAHASQSGGKFMFGEELDAGYARILDTPLRANAAILAAITRLAQTEQGAGLVGDIPMKLVRGISQTRARGDHWENTQENLFCMQALIEYARTYEQQAPDMSVQALMDGKSMGRTRFADRRDEAVIFEKPIGARDPGRKAVVSIRREGKGRLYYAARVHFAPLEMQARRVNAGLDIRREYSVERRGRWHLLKDPGEIKRGELVRVDIFLSLPAARHFVVVDDPVPGGLEPVNRDLATTSAVDARQARFQAADSSWWFSVSDWHAFNVSRWSFYHRELRHAAVRFYADYLPSGNYHLSYAAQAIAAGSFVKMPVVAQEMYDPDVYGKGMTGILRVLEDK